MSDQIVFYSVTDVSRMLSVSPHTVRDFIRRGRIRAVNISDGLKRPTYRISEQELTRFTTNRRRRRRA